MHTLSARSTGLTLAARIRSRDAGRNGLYFLALVFAGSLLLTLSAKISVPFYPVPMTLQTGAVLFLAVAFGLRAATGAVALYLLQGAMGLPVFAGSPEKGLGLAYMMGPTGGYLLGFLLATIVCGRLAERGWARNGFAAAATMLLGLAIIYASGTLWLGTLIGWDKPVLELGLYPFVAGDIVKVALAALAVGGLWRLIDAVEARKNR